MSLGKVFEHRFLWLSEPLGLFCIHAAVRLTPVVISGPGNLKNEADVSNGLALCDQLVSRFQLTDDLLLMCGGFVSFLNSRPRLAA